MTDILGMGPHFSLAPRVWQALSQRCFNQAKSQSDVRSCGIMLEP